MTIAMANWQEALSIRTCPPDAVLFGEKNEESVKRHIRLCPMCQETLNLNLEEDWEWPAEEGMVEEEISPGQVRRISRDLSGWNNGKIQTTISPSAKINTRYYNAPLVVVLDIDEEIVTVAQVTHFEAFVTKNDQHLGQGLYAESWNVYSMIDKDLEERVIVTVPNKIVNRILHRNDGEFKIKNDDYSDMYYRLEIEVGSYFSQSSFNNHNNL